LRGVSPSGGIVVRQDDDRPAPQRLVILRAPLAGPAPVARRNSAFGAQPFHVLFAFRDEYHRVRVGRQQFRQTVRHTPHAVQVPQPAAVAVGPALGESLRLVADGLVKQRAVRVAVIVGRHDAPLRALRALWRPGAQRRVALAVGRRRPQRGANRAKRAASVTVQQDAAVCARADAEAGPVVIVRRTARPPAAAAAFDAAKQRQNFV
jgi:hypothetical protein